MTARHFVPEELLQCMKHFSNEQAPVQKKRKFFEPTSIFFLP